MDTLYDLVDTVEKLLLKLKQADLSPVERDELVITIGLLEQSIRFAINKQRRGLKKAG
jgi:hypothetical protein